VTIHTLLLSYYYAYNSFSFFHAEDGIRYRNVTGVQTCALPISQDRADARQGPRRDQRSRRRREYRDSFGKARAQAVRPRVRIKRSEERRVGKEGRQRRTRLY